MSYPIVKVGLLVLLLSIIPSPVVAADTNSSPVLLRHWKAEFDRLKGRLVRLYVEDAPEEERGKTTVALMNVYTNIVMEVRANKGKQPVSLPNAATFDTLPGLLIKDSLDRSGIDTDPKSLFQTRSK